MTSKSDGVVIGVLTPKAEGQMPPPSHRPISKALKALNTKGIRVIFGDVLEHREEKTMMKGVVINGETDTWDKSLLPIAALHDRFPSQRRHEVYVRALKSLTVPMSNPWAITMLCRDKLNVQRILESSDIDMPPATGDASLFEDHLAQWGRAFLKPRFGALGKNVSEKKKGEVLAAQLEGMVPGRLEPTILQKSVDPPMGWAGLSVRVLCQRAQTSWVLRTPVLRCSDHDRVVNVARGAEALVAQENLPTETMDAIQAMAFRAIKQLEKTTDGEWMVEIGIDFVIDADYRPWLIEVNSRPRGRLEHLAETQRERFQDEHYAACLAPIEWLAWKSMH